MNPSRPARRDASRALYMEFAARGVCLRTGATPNCMPPCEAGELLVRVRANRAGLREVLVGRRNPDVLAVRQEGGTA